jgi:hypothetical protein
VIGHSSAKDLDGRLRGRSEEVVGSQEGDRLVALARLAHHHRWPSLMHRRPVVLDRIEVRRRSFRGLLGPRLGGAGEAVTEFAGPLGKESRAHLQNGVRESGLEDTSCDGGPHRLARVRGKSPAEYLTPTERDTAVHFAVDLLQSPAQSVDELLARSREALR